MKPVRSSSKTLVAALMGACLAAAPLAVHANNVPAPVVPPKLEVGTGYRPYLLGHAVGTQNYVCVPDPKGGFMWTLYGPQATLFDDDGSQMTTHFLSPNPDEAGKLRPAWQHSRDTSAVWAAAIEIETDPAWVEPGAIPWLLLEVKGWSRGPEGGRRLLDTVYIQRIHTSGGVAPATGCSEEKNLGDKVFVPYATDYYFYKARGRQK